MISFIYPSRIKDSNLGDVLINTLLVREISKYGTVYFDGEIPSLHELIVSNNKFASNIIVVKGIDSFEGKPLLRWINLLKVANKVSYTFDPPGAYFEGNNYFKSKLKFYKYYLRARILKKLFNVDMLRWGISLGPYSEKGYNDQKLLTNVYCDVAVRDSQNYRVLEQKSFENISLIDDLAFLYNKDDFKVLIDNNSDKQKFSNRYIVLSLRGNIEGHVLNEVYLNAVSVKVLELIKNFFVDIPDIVLAYQVVEDFESLVFVKSYLEQNGVKVILVDKQLDFASAIGLYSKAEFVVTNRLHVALLAILNDTVPIITTELASHHKLVNIFTDLHL
ncbi:MAG: polysaccharide pyruvyl transferase family protein, partial [Flavobacterium sp.]